MKTKNQLTLEMEIKEKELNHLLEKLIKVASDIKKGTKTYDAEEVLFAVMGQLNMKIESKIEELIEIRNERKKAQ